MGNIKEVTIEKGWYFSAGRGRWDCEEHSTEGVGLNRDLFNDSDTIIVKVKSKTGNITKYALDTQKGLNFIRANKSHETLGTVKVGYVPRSLMREV